MTRVLSGALLGGAVLALIWFGNTSLLLLVAMAVGVLAFHEYSELARAIGAAVPRAAALVAMLAALWAAAFPTLPLPGVLGLGVVLVAAAGMAGNRPALGTVAGAAAIVYLGIPLGTLVAVYVYGGRGAVLLLIATVVISDSAQYYAGRAFGRRPLAPRISPKKTIEGAVGGFVAAALFLYVAGPLFVPPAAPLATASLGLVLVACGIAGDLFESMLKRAANLKDSSALIPGHGGVLDRIDALLFATPPYYLFVRWIYTP